MLIYGWNMRFSLIITLKGLSKFVFQLFYLYMYIFKSALLHGLSYYFKLIITTINLTAEAEWSYILRKEMQYWL